MAWENFLQKNGVIIDRNQIAIEFNAFFKYAGPKLASKIPNSQRPFEVFIKNWLGNIVILLSIGESKEVFFPLNLTKVQAMMGFVWYFHGIKWFPRCNEKSLTKFNFQISNSLNCQ